MGELTIHSLPNLSNTAQLRSTIDFNTGCITDPHKISVGYIDSHGRTFDEEKELMSDFVLESTIEMIGIGIVGYAGMHDVSGDKIYFEIELLDDSRVVIGYVQYDAVLHGNTVVICDRHRVPVAFVRDFFDYVEEGEIMAGLKRIIGYLFVFDLGLLDEKVPSIVVMPDHEAVMIDCSGFDNVDDDLILSKVYSSKNLIISDFNGKRASINDNGLVMKDTVILGEITSYGKAYDIYKNLLGEINAGGQVVKGNGELYGEIDESNGDMRDADRVRIGTINGSGEYFDALDSYCGKVDNFTYHELRLFASYVFFFDMVCMKPSAKSVVGPSPLSLQDINEPYTDSTGIIVFPQTSYFVTDNSGTILLEIDKNLETIRTVKGNEIEHVNQVTLLDIPTLRTSIYTTTSGALCYFYWEQCLILSQYDSQTTRIIARVPDSIKGKKQIIASVMEYINKRE
eukprot:TRINITY_DN4524_c0_g1_i1.p1 TRINITY_DN4524_c0_g1~~TRINITY_DN4524_c0_g1_i1.p1  ORF type:complete len:528 (+),score=71.66 TRINITY_DN4524_c0_g1_i1:221-1585(+)